MQQGVRIAKQNECSVFISRINDECEKYESPSYSPIELSQDKSDYELMDYFNEIESKYNHIDIKEESSTITETNELKNLSTYLDSLDVLTNIIDQIETNNSHRDLTNAFLHKDTSQPKVNNICENNETIFKNIAAEDELEQLFASFSDRQESIINDIKKDQLTSNKDDVSKLSYSNQSTENEMIRRVEIIFLKRLKLAYDNLNDSIKNVYKLEDLNQNTCKYLLDQQIKFIVNEKSNPNVLKLKWFLLLVACFEALDLLFNCNWESMMFFVYHSLNIYDKCIKSNLEEILIEIREIIRPDMRKSLPLLLNDIYSLKTPKIYNLCQYINEFKYKSAQNLKFVIVIKRNNEILIKSLVKYIQESTNLKIYACEQETDQTNKILNESDGLLVLFNFKLNKYIKNVTNLIVYDYPQMNDSLECKQIETIRNLCYLNQINYIQFETYIAEESIRNQLILNLNTLKPLVVNNPNELIRQIIVSPKLLNNSDFIEWFEYKLNYELIERNVDYIANEFEIKKELLCSADILIDEFTGISILDLDKFIYLNETDLNNQIKLVKFKIDLLYLIFSPFNKNSKTNLLSIYISGIYVRLIKFCNELNKKSNEFKIKPIFLSKSDQLVSTIDRICSFTFQNERLCGNKNSLSRTITNQEAFLLSLGCFNSYNAQRILSFFELIDIINLNDYDQIKHFSVMSQKKFNLLYKILNFK